jgi:hypothetical protein
LMEEFLNYIKKWKNNIIFNITTVI